MADSFIQWRPPTDGNDYDCACARCGSTLVFEPCEECGGDGFYDGSEWDDDELHTCNICGGEAAYPLCISTHGWCLTNPLPGRGDIERSMPEWFRIDRASPPQATPDKDKETDRG